MGKRERIVRKKINREKKKKIEEQNYRLKLELKYAIENDDYQKGLDILSEMVKNGYRENDVFYYGALLYYMQGDLLRAAKWIEDALNNNAPNIESRLLLAQICLQEERMDDALAIYTFLLRQFRNTLTNKDINTIRDCVSGEWDITDNWLQDNYPLVYNFTFMENR